MRTNRTGNPLAAPAENGVPPTSRTPMTGMGLLVLKRALESLYVHHSFSMTLAYAFIMIMNKLPRAIRTTIPEEEKRI